MKKRYIILGGVAGLIVLGALAGGESDSGKSPAANKQRVAVNVTASEISKAFQTNEARAKLDYDGKTLIVTGVVKDIDLNITDSPVIKLKGSGDQFGMGVNNDGKMTDVDISGLSTQDAANISKNQKLTFTCNDIGEIMGSAQLSDCAIAK